MRTTTVSRNRPLTRKQSAEERQRLTSYSRTNEISSDDDSGDINEVYPDSDSDGDLEEDTSSNSSSDSSSEDEEESEYEEYTIVQNDETLEQEDDLPFTILEDSDDNNSVIFTGGNPPKVRASTKRKRFQFHWSENISKDNDVKAKKNTPVDKVCAICMDNVAQAIINPCGHSQICFTCLLKMEDKKNETACPFCRTLIQDVITRTDTGVDKIKKK